jgi:hypothetical protein
VGKVLGPTEEEVAAQTEGDPPSPSDGSDAAADANTAADGVDKDLAETTDEGDKPDELFKPEELKNASPRVRKRIEKLASTNRLLRQEIETHRPIVESFRDFSDVERDALSGVARALNQGRFDVFLEAVQPYIDLANEMTGRKLPADLQSKVDDGYATPEIAAELARTRADAAIAAQRAGRYEQETASREVQAHRQNIAGAVNSWAEQMRVSDPDFPNKYGLLEDLARADVAVNGVPLTSQEAVVRVAGIYQRLNGHLPGRAVARQSTRPTPTGSVKTATGVRPEPRSLAEAVSIGLANAR